MNEDSPATWADYRAAVTRFVEAVDSVLEQGRAAEMRYENFCHQHGIRPGIGEQMLTAETLPPAQRHIHRRLLELNEKLYATLLSSTPERRRTVASTAPRALGSRNRI